MSWHLDYPVKHKKLDLPEIQSLDPKEVVTHKVESAYSLLKRPVLVEDITIRFEALGRLPGTFIKQFLSELKVDGLCKLLDGYKTRKVWVEPHFAFFDGKELKVFSATIEGKIAKTPKGDSGFGMDSIFIPIGHAKTWGEMTKEEQIETSVRKVALKKLQKYLRARK